MKKAGRILFYRRWTKRHGGTSGGQLKVVDAYRHSRLSNYEPKVFFSKDTRWYDNPGNHWLPYKEDGIDEWVVNPTDILFFAGKDWEVLSEDERRNPKVPILNIVHPRQLSLRDIRYEAFAYPAIRIVKSHGAVGIIEKVSNGPVFCIPDAIDVDLINKVKTTKEIDILIVGLKNPKFAKRLDKFLNFAFGLLGKKVNIFTQNPPKLPTRMDFLELLGKSKISIFLPLPASKGGEGFYLPALEAMALGTLVICPDVIGNRDFCRHNETCLMPDYNLISFLSSALRFQKMTHIDRQRFVDSGKNEVKNHTIEKESERYVDLINRTPSIWKSYFGPLNKSID